MGTDLTLGLKDTGASHGSAEQPWHSGYCSVPNSADMPNFLLLGHLLSQAPLQLAMQQSSGQRGVGRSLLGASGKAFALSDKRERHGHYCPFSYPRFFCLGQNCGWREQGQTAGDHEARLREGRESRRHTSTPGLTLLCPNYS